MEEWVILGQNFADIIQYTIWGLLTGGIYALIALGIVVINKASGVFNFAHGWMMFVGGMFFWQFFDNDMSPQITFALSGASALLIAGVIASMGISTIAAPQRVAPPAEFGVAQRISRGERLRRRVNDFLYRLWNKQRVTVVIGVGFIAWLVVGIVLTSDNEIIRGAMAAFILTIIIGLLIERFTIRPLLGQPILTAILMTLAITFILHGIALMIWGPTERPVAIFVEESTFIQVPKFDRETNQVVTIEQELPGKSLPDYTVDTTDLLGKEMRLQRYLVWGFGISIACFLGFVFLFRFTPIGLAMRATAENQVLAESLGLRVRLILAVAWALVTVMAGIAGILLGTGPGGLSMLVIPALALRVFPAVLLGGLDSVTGALAGGIIIGLVESLSTLFISTSVGQEAMPFVILMIVLMIRPNGLFGQREIERV